MIEITDRTVGMWFAATGRGHDFLMHCAEITPGNFEILSRIRTYAGPNTDPFDGTDTKQWFRCSLFGDRAMAIEKCRLVFAGMRTAFNVEADEVLYESEDQFFAAMKTKSWFHMRELTLEEYEKEYAPINQGH